MLWKHRYAESQKSGRDNPVYRSPPGPGIYEPSALFRAARVDALDSSKAPTWALKDRILMASW